MEATRIKIEWLKCAESVVYFVSRYCQIYDATDQRWLRFALWPEQGEVLEVMATGRLLVLLKARQLGMTWLCLAYALWVLLMQAPATVLLFSLRQAEAVEMLGRLKEMHRRLPLWMQAKRVVRENESMFALSNGSRALAFSTNGGRSYTATLAVVDEADFVGDLATFLSGVKPTIDAGGKLFLVSTSDKKRPVSTYKNLFAAARGGVGDYRALFLPWSVHPRRNAEWYGRTKAEYFAQRGTHDDFYAEYPATPEEALAPEQLDRRIPYDWLREVYVPSEALRSLHAPAIPGLAVYVEAVEGAMYVVGVDPAEGNPHSDDSAVVVMEVESWGEVATVVGKFEPAVLASFVDVLARYYNQAEAMVERNNHGHSVLRALQEQGRTRVLAGYDGKPGWLSNVKGKPLLYDACAEAVRDRVCVVRSSQTASQLASIEASTLRAPQGLADDRADAYALAVVALAYGYGKGVGATVVAGVDPLAGVGRRGWREAVEGEW